MFGKSLYERVKVGVEYDEETHCPMVLDSFLQGKGISEFCSLAAISRQRMVAWQTKYPTFKECVQIGKEIGVIRWMQEGQDNIENRDFSMKLWEAFGRKNFGSLDKVTLFIDAKGSPIEQYRQLIDQASTGDFTSAEIKQLMESINIGLRAYEVGELQNEITELQEGLKQMKERELENKVTNFTAAKENKAAVVSAVR